MATAEEIRRAREETSVFAPLFEYARSNRSQLASEGRRPVLGGLLSKEPVMGTDTLRYEGVGSLLANLLDPIARGVDAPRAAAQDLIPQEDMVGEALGTAGTAMLGGGAVAKPAGSLGANTLRVYHGTDADISQLDPNYGVTARDLYTTPVRSDAAEYGKNVLEFDVEGKIGNFLPEDRGISETRMLQTAYSDYGLDDYFDSFDDFVEAFDSGNMYQRFGSSAAQDEVVGALIDVGGFDAIRIPDAGFGGNMSESVVAQNPNVFKPVMANASKSAGLLSVASDVSARGDQILNMLKSGRGPEVTDAMLDMGDSVKNTQLNQYLAANYDLPMDEASRLARAREMGFNVDDVQYHGTAPSMYSDDDFSPDITAFIPGVKGQLGAGVYVAPDVRKANKFASAGEVNRGDFDPNKAVPRGGSVLPVYIRSSNPASYGEMRNAQYGLENVSGFNDLSMRGTQSLSDEGFTGVRTGNEENVFDPNNIRSTNARFDPRLSELENIMAANASPISGLLAQSGVSSEQAQRIEDYLLKTGLLQ